MPNLFMETLTRIYHVQESILHFYLFVNRFIDRIEQIVVDRARLFVDRVLNEFTKSTSILTHSYHLLSAGRHFLFLATEDTRTDYIPLI